MQDRPVIVRDGSGSSNMAMFSIVAIVAIAVLVGLFYWQPWNTQPHNSTTTVISQPNNPPAAQAPAAQAGGAQAGGANSGSNANSGASNGQSSSGGSNP